MFYRKFYFDEKDILEGGPLYEAKIEAEHGRVSGTLYHLEKIDLDQKETKEIIYRAYERGIPFHMRNARKFALSGNVYRMEDDIKKAVKFSKKLGVELPKTSIAIIRRKGYLEKIGDYIDETLESLSDDRETNDLKEYSLSVARMRMANEYLKVMDIEKESSNELEEEMCCIIDKFSEKKYSEAVERVKNLKSRFDDIYDLILRS